MTSAPNYTPEEERELLVVYPTLEAAEEARLALVQAGVPERDISIDREPDKVAALRAEMHDEMAEAWVVPNAAVAYTKKSAQGLAAGSAVGVGIGLVLAAVAAIPDYAATYPVRFLVCALVGVAFGFTIGMVAGAGLGSERPGRLPDAARGHLLRVSHDSPSLRQLLADLGPIRMDEISHDGDPIANVVHEDREALLDDVVDTAKDMASRTPSDDYTPERDPESDHRRADAR
ncbi:MAG TPA: hypothetical protein VJ804_07885 [Acidimicrobiales bacterium]|nr:hypothetical protein [Acidimicrobiales bacterium]